MTVSNVSLSRTHLKMAMAKNVIPCIIKSGRQTNRRGNESFVCSIKQSLGRPQTNAYITDYYEN